MYNGIDKLLTTIRATDEETARNLLVSHINDLAENLIENSWKRSRNLLRFQRKNKKQQLKKFILTENEYDKSIALVDLVRFVACIQDTLEDGCNNFDDVKDFADEVESVMYTKLGSLRIDRRSMFQKEN